MHLLPQLSSASIPFRTYSSTHINKPQGRLPYELDDSKATAIFYLFFWVDCVDLTPRKLSSPHVVLHCLHDRRRTFTKRRYHMWWRHRVTSGYVTSWWYHAFWRSVTPWWRHRVHVITLWWPFPSLVLMRWPSLFAFHEASKAFSPWNGTTDRWKLVKWATVFKQWMSMGREDLLLAEHQLRFRKQSLIPKFIYTHLPASSCAAASIPITQYYVPIKGRLSERSYALNTLHV